MNLKCTRGCHGGGAYRIVYRVYGIGPEINYFSPKYKLGYNLRAWCEFGARDRTEGQIITLTLIKPF
jgi:hypothetical protein